MSNIFIATVIDYSVSRSIVVGATLIPDFAPLLLKANKSTRQTDFGDALHP
jgi:hypothetical protein